MFFFSKFSYLIFYCFKNTQKFEKKVFFNYSRRIKKLKDLYCNIDKELLETECINYQTNFKYCFCGKSYVESNLFGADIPCYHQLFIGKDVVPSEEIKTPKFYYDENKKTEVSSILDGKTFSKHGRKKKIYSYSQKLYSIQTQVSKFIEESIDILSKMYKN